jgi:hypothetical protein
MRSKNYVIIAIILSAALAAFNYIGCGGGSSGSSRDTTAPTVSSKCPAANAINVALNAVITATFSEAMDPATISSTTFTLYDYNAEEAIASTVIYDEDSKTATLTPAADLELARLYQARISVSVKDLAGNAISGGMFYYSWTFFTRDGAWDTDLRIDTNETANDPASPHVAMGPNGNGIAVWAQMTNTQYSILASRYISGTGWAASELLETDDTNMALWPKVAIDSAGNAICVWAQVSGSYLSVFANRYTEEGGWGGAEPIHPAATGDADAPQIAINPSGNAICVWQQSNGTTNSIWANTYISPTGWGTLDILEVGDGDALNPQIAIDPSGNAIAVWSQVDGGQTNIMANYYDFSDTDWSGAETIDLESGVAANPQIALDPWGDGLAVWQQVSGTYSSIFASRYVSGTGWSAAILIETNETGNATLPRIAIDTQGFGIAVWQHEDLDVNRRDIWGAFYNCEGDDWLAPERLEASNENAGHLCPPLIAFDQDQRAMAIWVQSDGEYNNFYYNRYIYGLGWGSAGLFEAADGDVINQYALAFDLLGNAMAVWRHWGSTVDEIRANRFIFE